MSLSGAKEDPEDKTGGSFPAVNQCVGNSVQNVTLELLLPETSWLLSATMQMRWKESIFHWRSVAYVSLGRFIFNWKLISHKTIFWVSAMQWVFLSRPPHKPHPSPSALRGLLPAQEAELEVKRTGPGPSVSPWLQGSDYVHGTLNPTHDTHSRENTEPATATEAPPGLMSMGDCLHLSRDLLPSHCKTGHVTRGACGKPRHSSLASQQGLFGKFSGGR